MPQLIAMVIVVVGAMIYMFQTFGGTGDKIEGIAQKTSVITEINNIKNGLQLAVRSGDVSVTTVLAADGTVTSGAATTLKSLADLEYFADQINDELNDNTAVGANTVNDVNSYSAISFGGEEDSPNMLISLVLPASAAEATANARPGLFVDLTQGNLSQNAAFLEAQLASDLGAVATIDRGTTTTNYNTTLDSEGNIGTETDSATAKLTDGTFTIYFKDIRAGMIE